MLWALSSYAETVPYIQTNSGKKLDASQILNTSSSGTEFVVALPPNELYSETNWSTEYQEIYITSPFNITVRWKSNINGGSGIGTPISVPAYRITKISLQQSDEIREFEKPVNKTFTLTSAKRFSVYVMNRKVTTSDGYLAIPTSAWGKEYIHLCNYDNPEGNGPGGYSYGSGFVVLAKYDNTHVRIKLVDQANRNATPSPNGVGRTTGWPVGTNKHKGGDIINVTLMKNQAYEIQGDGAVANFDLSGSEILSDSIVGVISYHNRTDLPVSLNSSRNYMVEMITPVQSWGKRIVTVEFDRKQNGGKGLGDLIRVVASQNNTTINMRWYNKVLTSKPLIKSLSKTIQRGEVFEYTQNDQTNSYTQKGCQGTTIIEADSPILAHQYSYSSSWDNANDFDPFMISLTPVEQYVPETVFQTPSGFSANFYNFIAIGYLPSDTVGNTPFATNSVIDTNPATARPWTQNEINKAKLKSLKFGSSGELTPVPDGIFRNRIPTTGGWAPENSDGRDTVGGLYWYTYQTAEGIFQMVSEGPDGQPLTKFGGYIYGFDGADGYGWPAAGTYVSVKTQDTIAPKRQAKKTICTTTQYTFTDSLDFWLAPPKDTVHQVDTWIKGIRFLTDTHSIDKKLKSFNMIFVDNLNAPLYTYFPLKGANGKDSLDIYNKNIVYDSTFAVRLSMQDSIYKFGVKVLDPFKEARSIIAVSDGASNITYDTVTYFPPLISLDPNPMDFGKVRIKTAAERAASPTAIKTTTITNVGHGSRQIKKIRLVSEINNHTSPFKISTATKLPLAGFTLDSIGGVKPNFYKFDIEFTPERVSKDLKDKLSDSIFIQFDDACSEFYIPISGISIAPRIQVNPYILIDTNDIIQLCDKKHFIKNEGNDTLTISAFKGLTDTSAYLTDLFTAQINPAQALLPFTLSKANGDPIFPPTVKIAPKDSFNIKLCFDKASSEKLSKYLVFVSDAYREDSYKNNEVIKLGFPIGVPSLVYPDSGASNIKLQTQLVWNSIKGATKYKLILADSRSFDNLLFSNFVKDTSMTIDLPNDKVTYYWRVKAYSNTDSSNWSQIWYFFTDNASGVEDARDNQFQISPNPASNELNIAYTLQNGGDYSIMIYNSIGELIRVASIGNKESGAYTEKINVADLVSGAYRIVLKEGLTIKTYGITIVK